MMRSIRPLAAMSALVLLSAEIESGGASRSDGDAAADKAAADKAAADKAAADKAAADKAAADKAASRAKPAKGDHVAIMLQTSSVYGPDGRQIVRNTVVSAPRARADGLFSKSKARLATKDEIKAAGDPLIVIA